MQITMRAARTNAGLTQEEASKRLGISETTLRNWESGKSTPRASKFPDICRLYNCPIENLIFFESNLR